MFKTSCPACGADLVYKSKSSIYAVCSYCKSSAVRTDLNVAAYGKVSELQEDMTPFMIGTLGFYENKRFEIIGRARIAWQDGFWNEWYLLFSDQSEAWLAEAQGFYAISFMDETKTIPSQNSLAVNGIVSFRDLNNKIPNDQIPYTVTDIKEARYVGLEGELPFRASLGSQFTCIDLNAPGERFASLEFKNDNSQTSAKLFIGQYLSFDEFNFSNLRQIEGW